MSVEDRLDKLEHIIYGNGKPGLAEDVRNLNANVSKILENQKSNNDKSEIVRHKIIIGVSVGVVVSVFNLLITIFHK